jgi:hypothetical protein
MKYLVIGSGGPGFTSEDEAVQVLKSVVLPSFTELERLEKEKKIIAGGLPGEIVRLFLWWKLNPTMN